MTKAAFTVEAPDADDDDDDQNNQNESLQRAEEGTALSNKSIAQVATAPPAAGTPAPEVPLLKRRGSCVFHVDNPPTSIQVGSFGL